MTIEPNTGHCHLCDEDMPSVKLLDHVRIMHPNAYGDGPERWPDDGLVVIDETLEPDEFSADGPP